MKYLFWGSLVALSVFDLTTLHGWSRAFFLWPLALLASNLYIDRALKRSRARHLATMAAIQKSAVMWTKLGKQGGWEDTPAAGPFRHDRGV